MVECQVVRVVEGGAFGKYRLAEVEFFEERFVADKVVSVVFVRPSVVGMRVISFYIIDNKVGVGLIFWNETSDCVSFGKSQSRNGKDW